MANALFSKIIPCFPSLNASSHPQWSGGLVKLGIVFHRAIFLSDLRIITGDRNELVGGLFLSVLEYIQILFICNTFYTVSFTFL